jgi:hypothetical protein
VEEVRSDLTEEQCRTVLDECRRRFNADINWDMLRACAGTVTGKCLDLQRKIGGAEGI